MRTQQGRATPKALAAIFTIAVVMMSAGFAIGSLPPGGTFIDDNGNVHEGDIEALTAAGLTNGCNAEEKRYCPAASVTRAEMSAFITRAVGLNPSATHSGHFSDVPEQAWYAPYVESLHEAGIANGYKDGKFYPSSPVTRAEMSALLVRAIPDLSAADRPSSFSDVPDDDWYQSAAEGLMVAGVTKGCGTDPLRFCPSDPVLRDQMAAFIGRALGLEPIIPPPGEPVSSLSELHVDGSATNASDANVGSSVEPLLTVQEAIDRATTARKEGRSIRIVVHPGVYREQLDIGPAGANPPLVIEAAAAGTAVISGSDVWTNWQNDAATNSMVHDWPHDWGPAGGVEPIVGRREIVFIAGQRLSQVMRSSDLGPGTFFVDEAANRIHVRASEGFTQAEVAVRPRTLVMDGARNVTVRGFVFQHAASRFESASVQIVNGGNHAFDQNTVVDNSWVGLAVITLSDVAVTNSTIDRNGGGGMEVYQAPGLWMESNSTSFNNWRGVQGDYTGWSIAGVKMVGQHDTTIRDHTSVGNSTRGFWLDYDVRNITIEASDFSQNLTDGLYVEAAPGPISISGTTMTGNGRYGLLIVNTDRVTVARNTLCANAKSAVRFDSDPGGRTVSTPDDSVWLPSATNLSMTGNRIGTSPRVIDANIPSDQLAAFTSTLTANGNTYFPIDASSAFLIGGSQQDLGSWQAATGQDLNSTIGTGSC